MLYSSNAYTCCAATSSAGSGGRQENIKPLTGLCRVWDCQNASCSLRMNLSAGMQPWVFYRVEEEEPGRRVLTAKNTPGAEWLEISCKSGAAEPCRSAIFPSDMVQKSPLQMKRPPSASRIWNHNTHLTLFTPQRVGLISGNKWWW